MVNLHPYNTEGEEPIRVDATLQLADADSTRIAGAVVWMEPEGLDGRDAQPALIGRHYVTERDSAPVQYTGIV